MKRSIVAGKFVEEGFAGQQMIVLPPDLLHEVQKNKLINSLYLTAIGYYPHASYHYRERTEGSKQYILLYCIDGKGFVNTQQAKKLLLPNSYIILPKDAAHTYGSSADNPWSIYWVHFSGSNADLLYNRYKLQHNNDPVSIAYDAHRIALFSSVISKLTADLNAGLVELANISFFQLITSFVYQTTLETVAAPDQVSKALRFMKDNLSLNYKIADFAAAAKLSVSRYSDIFKKRTGFSPIIYFNRLKIQQACQLLYFSDLNIKEISAKVGIDDPYYFSRLFKQQMGISPANYRKVYKK